jgi:hypothetical protein
MRGIPENLTIDSEPDYEIFMTYPEGMRTRLHVANRSSWKRLSAITHARSYAKRYPLCKFHVTVKA